MKAINTILIFAVVCILNSCGLIQIGEKCEGEEKKVITNINETNDYYIGQDGDRVVLQLNQWVELACPTEPVKFYFFARVDVFQLYRIDVTCQVNLYGETTTTETATLTRSSGNSSIRDYIKDLEMEFAGPDKELFYGSFGASLILSITLPAGWTDQTINEYKDYLVDHMNSMSIETTYTI